jgi:protein ImuB
VPRYACLLVPDLALAAALRAEPELRGRPLALIEPGAAAGAPIAAGWLRGLSLAQARAVEPALEVRPLSFEALEAAREALIDVALSAGPRVMEPRPGLVFLEIDGLEALFPTGRGLLTALESRAREVGLDPLRLALGPTRTAAELAARWREGGQLVEGDARAFLAALPLDLLEPDDELAERLQRWGVRTLGELAALPRGGLGARLGEAGVQLARRARGEDLEPFRPAPARQHFEESAECGWAVDDLEALAFPLRGVLDRLVRRLRLRGLAVRRVWLELELEDGQTRAREIDLAAPTLETAVLLGLVRLALERDPPPAPVERMRAIATPGGVETAQLDLFLPPLPAPAELAMTVARIESLVGSGGVAAPGVRDTHLPDALQATAFRFNVGEARRAVSPPAGLAARACMAQRALRPPRSARVQTGANGRPTHVTYDARHGVGTHAAQRAEGERSPARHGEGTHAAQRAEGERSPKNYVLEAAGPWRFFGEWWGDAPFARDYWDVQLADGGVYRLYHDLAHGAWFVDGIYD